MVKSEPVTPLDRPKATESLGGFLLIGHSHQYPLDRRNAKKFTIIWGLPVQT